MSVSSGQPYSKGSIPTVEKGCDCSIERTLHHDGSLSASDTSRGRGLSKLVISRVIIRVTPFRALITLLITYLLSPPAPSSMLVGPKKGPV